ncbi:MAG: hypothetical protein KDF64_13240, partial [Geminicoccaceae bacterium]|nr:hypothetical protein [Geminicoccaceae bacterium]
MTTEDGLPSGVVYDIFEDSRGWVWVGTDGGLARFDGRRFQTYLPGNRPGDLGTNFINKIIEDAQGRIWVSGWGGGLHLYDPLTDDFTRFRHDPGDPSSMPSDNPQDLLVDRSGQLWIGTFGGGLAKLLADGGHFERITPPADIEVDPRVWLMAEDRDGRFWIATWGGLYRFDPQGNEWEKIVDDRELDPPFDDRILYLRIDSRDQLWIGTWGGMYRVECRNDRTRTDCREFRFERLTNGAKHAGKIPSGAVWHIEEVDAGRLWFADNEGIGEYRLGEETLRRIPLNDNNWPAPITTMMFAIERARNGNIWLGGQYPSLFYFDSHQRVFDNIIHTASGDPLGIIVDISMTDDDRIWLTNGSGELFVAHADNFDFGKVDLKGIGDHKVVLTRPLRDGGLLLTIAGKGAWKMDADTFEVTRIEVSDPPPGFELNNIAMALELPDRRILFASLDGLLEVDPLTGDNHQIKAIVNGRNLLAGTIHNTIVHDERKNRIHVGMQNAGLISVDLADPANFVSYRYDRNDPNSLNSDYVRDIALDDDGNIWAATTMGIARIDAGTGVVSRLAGNHRITELASYCITVDHAGGIVFSVPAIGVGRLDPAAGQIDSFASDSGLGSGMSAYANCESHGDLVVIGRPFGLTLMAYRELDDYRTPSDVVASIVNIESGNLQALLDTEGREVPVWDARTIQIGSSGGSIRLRLAVLGQTPDWNGRIAYRLYEAG